MNMKKLSTIAVAVLFAGAAQAQNVQRGQKLYEECAACHATKAGESGVGPSLAGALGRKAGENPDFRFSPAMRRSGITWDQKSLNEFIADPQKVVPDNRMPYGGMPDAANRADLISYLLTVMK
jgi:cytochrome c